MVGNVNPIDWEVVLLTKTKKYTVAFQVPHCKV